jgi:hypothetical protein
MPRLRPLLVVLLALLVPPAASLAASEGKPRASDPLRGSQCLDPSFTRSFTTVDDRTLLVDGGRHRYLIEVAGSCWNLDFANAIGFRGDPISRRVCGGPFDAILLRGEPPCHIDRMSIISKEEYKAAMQHRAQWLEVRKAQKKQDKK